MNLNLRFSFVLVCLIATLGSSALAQSPSRVYDSLELPSKILGGPKKYAVYLPPGYDQSSRKYPVLYLLHGAGDNQTGWIQFGEVQHIADRAIAAGEATPMIIIMPDASGERMGYFNSVDGKWKYEDFFFEEFLPAVEKEYAIKSEKRYRAVAGLSMGGGGSFMYALHHPELFSAACPLSAFVGPLSIEEFRKNLVEGKVSFEEEALEPYMARHNAVRLIDALSEKDLSAVRWYIDCGDDDFLYEGNSLAHIALRKKNIPHEFRIRDGGHQWSYWRSALPEVLRFVSAGFHQN
jgi:enterochelin esterase-like enzyme